MANVVVEEQSLIDIASAIRTKNETDNTYKPSEMANAILDIPTNEVVDPTLQEKTITPTTSSQTVTPDTNYDGLSKVTINGVTSAIDNDIKATNIRKGIDILGVTGTLEEGITPSGTLDITSNGTYDVTNYASTNVNVPSSGGETSEYTRVDYIQFEGNQLVDTGIIGNQDTQICASFTWESSTQRHLYGCASSDNKKSVTSYMNGSWRFGNKSSSKTFSSKEPKLPYSSLVNKTKISITNSNTNISGVADFETVGTLLLGGARDSDGTLPTVGIIGKVFYFYIWQGEEQVLKFVPVVNKDGIYGFYDEVSKNFFTSITDTPLEGGYL